MSDLTILLERVKELAEGTGHIFAQRDALRVNAKGPGDFVTQVDYQVSELLCEGLPRLLPGSRVISEEGPAGTPDDGYCWIVDPVDGTTNMIYGLPLFAVSIGLLHRGKPVLGVVRNPVTGETFFAAQGSGAYLDGRPIRVCGDKAIANTLVLSETNPYVDRGINKTLGATEAMFRDCIDYRITGSAALDVCLVACGAGGLFFSQGLNPWDYTGGCAILLEAGGSFSQWDGTEIPYQGNHTFLASNGRLHEEALGRLKEFC